MSCATSSTQKRTFLSTVYSAPVTRQAMSALALVLACCAAPAALAQQSPADSGGDRANSMSVYVQGAWAEHSTDTTALGVTLPWGNWTYDLMGGQVRGYWDVSVTRLSFDRAPDRDYSHTWMLGVIPTLRWRPDAGRSPWFAEAGIGATYMKNRYVSAHTEFSTRFNFASHLGVGYNFGEQRRHELQMRVEHISNAGIDHPNPGENFVQVRYAYHF